MQEERAKKTNYNAIDLGKFICAILVVTIHVKPFGANGSEVFTFLNLFLKQYIARIAVPFFFITSGFLLFRKTNHDN